MSVFLLLESNPRVGLLYVVWTWGNNPLSLFNRGICVAVAGITADANNLIDYAQVACQKHLFRFNESIPVEHLVQDLCNLKQGYTQYGGLRPFGVSFLFAGYDPIYGFQLYHSDPSGNYAGWLATCIGANSSNAKTLLKQDMEKEEKLSLKEAKSLAVKVLSKTMDSTTLTADKRECLLWHLLF